MKFNILIFLLSILSYTTAFARCNGHYADVYIEDIFELGAGALRKDDAKTKEISSKLGSGKLGDDVSSVCMGGCYLPSSPEDIKSCEVKYRIAVQKNIVEAEGILNKKANKTKFVQGYCEYSADAEPTNFDAKAYAAETNKSCSSTGCLPSNLTICRSHAVCIEHPKYGSESYAVSCVGTDGRCPGVDDCMADVFTQPKDKILKSKMNTIKSSTTQQ